MTTPPTDVNRPASVCAICGRPMAEDQEWCLECGTGRTTIARPPDWRIPALVIAVVALLIVGGFVYALIRLGSSAGRVTVVTAAPTVTHTTTSMTALADWPPGLDGWTVVLASASTRAAADAEARRALPHILGIGVLATSQHPQMSHPGRWDIFAGRYPSASRARAAALSARRGGHPQATEALVQTPGG